MRKPFRLILAMLLFLIIGFFVTNFFVTKKVKTLLDQKKNLSYSSFNTNAFTGSLNLEDIKFEGMDKIINIKNADINIDILQYLLNDKLIIENIDAEELNLELNSSPDSKPKDGQEIEIAGIEKINLKNANVTYREHAKIVFELSELNLYVEDVDWPLDENYRWLRNETLKIKANDLHYAMDTLHDLKSEDFKFSEQSFSFTNFSIEPKFTKSEYVNHIQTEKDLITMTSQSLKILGFEVKSKENSLHISTRKIQLDSTDVEIYRDKTIADDTSYKALYSEALRSLDFQIEIDSLMISEMNITYQELLTKHSKAAEIKFNSTQAQVHNIHNSLNAEEPTISVKAQSKFSEGSEILFDMNFVPDYEEFYASTSLKQVEDKSINSFFSTGMRMEMEGKVDEITTSIYGNNSVMNGDFSIAYDNLKLNILKKDGSKNNFASLLSNALINNKNVEESHELKQIKRNTTKSFWNFLWSFHLKGLRQTLL